MSDAVTPTIRELRREAHRVFDPLWQKNVMSRTRAYDMLSQLLDLPRPLTHFSMMDEQQLRKAIDHFARMKVVEPKNARQDRNRRRQRRYEKHREREERSRELLMEWQGGVRG